MNIAYSTAGHPNWDAVTVIKKAAEHGFGGVELRSLPEQLHMPLAENLGNSLEQIVAAARANNVRILCLATQAAFSHRDSRMQEANKSHVRDQLELADRLGCPYVRVLVGSIPDLPVRVLGRERRDTTTLRIATALREIGDEAAARNITLLVENSGDFCESSELWQVTEAANSAGVQCAWNPIAARSVDERASTAIPRLASRLKLVRISDGKVDGAGRLREHTSLGDGDLDVYRTIQLLRGLGYRGVVVFDHPIVWNGEEAADELLAAAAKKLTELIEESPVSLTAYKGDKFPPRQGYDLIATAQPEEQGEEVVGG